MAGEREFEPAAERVAPDCGDHRLPGAFDDAHDLLAAAREPERCFGGEVPQLGDVRPGDEGAVTGAGEDDAVELRVRVEFLEGRRERLDQVPVQGVERLRPVHRDEGVGMPLRRLPAFAQEGAAVGHAGAPLPVPFPAASTTMAMPWPPPMQAVARP